MAIIKKIGIHMIPGVIASLLASGLLSLWGDVGDVGRIFVSLILGIGVIVLIFLLNAENSVSIFSIANNIRAKKSVKLKDIFVENPNNDVQIANHIQAEEGDVTITNVNVKRGVSTNE